ncbi:MAG: PLD nuclease N-terminal domain-containing protein [Mycobacterium leprae]
MTPDLKAMLPIVAPILLIDLILIVVALVDLVRREPERVRGPKWLWALVILLVSTLGPIIYLVIGRKE